LPGQALLSPHGTEPAVLANWLAGRHAEIVFVADDLAAWLIGVLADAGRKKLTSLVLGDEQERALRPAAAEAVQLTAEELCPSDAERAEELAVMIGPLFKTPVPGGPLGGQATVLEALQVAVAGQLAVLGDPGLSATVKSLTGMPDVSATVVAQKLTSHLLREIVARGSRGGPLEPLANQLNHDVTHLQGQRMEAVLGQLTADVREALTRPGGTHAVAAPTALAQLPPQVAGFAGRDDELAVLAELLDPAGSAGPMVVSAVAGLAGVGKTTLAVAAGHAARQEGWFGGGVLFIDLHGYDEVPVEPSQALDALLRALGVAAEHIPPGVEERAGLYRSVLAEIGEPVLVIADNASAEVQVRPLLPGAGPHKVVVTSRHTLAGLGARLIDVTVLDDDASVELLDEALRVGRPEDDRISADREAAGRLAGVCGGLPLALQITAALLKADPPLTARELAEELAVESERLEQLRYGENAGPSVTSVAAAFELSYRRLEEVPARVFRLLPVNPGPDISTAAAAILADLPVSKVRGVLAGLARAHIVEAASGVASRWQMHDLLRLYAQRLSDEYAEADGREQARDRLLGYYMSLTAAASEYRKALPGMAPPDEFTSRDDAVDWLDAERPNLVAAVSMAADTGRGTVAWELPIRLSSYLGWRRRFDDMLATATISLNTARSIGARSAEGLALLELGSALTALDRFDEAITAYKDAASILREEGLRAEVGAALTNLNDALRRLERFDEAVTVNQDAVAIFREIGDRQREGMALSNLGSALTDLDRPEEAITTTQGAVAIFREIGDRGNEATALARLGLALQWLERFDEAITAHQTAASIFGEIGDRQREGAAVGILGLALQEVQRFDEAIAAHQDAAAIFRETDDRHSEGNALDNLGLALVEMRRFDEAIAAHQKAAAIMRETGDQRGEGIVLDNLERARAAQEA
jgi:tetratricopeptide (TPR) repeat protein